MSCMTAPTPTSAVVPSISATPATMDPLAEAKLEVGRASAEISAINNELDRLTLAKAHATAKFNLACHRLGQLKQKEIA